MNINRKYLCSNLLPCIYSIGFDGSKTRYLSDRNRFYFDQILIPSEAQINASKYPSNGKLVMQLNVFNKVIIFKLEKSKLQF